MKIAYNENSGFLCQKRHSQDTFANMTLISWLGFFKFTAGCRCPPKQKKIAIGQSLSQYVSSRISEETALGKRDHDFFNIQSECT